MNKDYAKNKKAFFDYEMLETYEAGISLSSSEVKSIREWKVTLLGSYASVDGNSIILKQCSISKPDNITYNSNEHSENRHKKLLLNKKEIEKIKKRVSEKGISLIVTKIYQRDNTKFIKCTLNVAKGKRNYDKRETIKRRESDIDTARQLKDY